MKFDYNEIKLANVIFRGRERKNKLIMIACSIAIEFLSHERAI